MVNKLQNKKDAETSRTVLTLFIIIFPSLLIAGDYGLTFMGNIILKGSLIFYQFIILKRFLDDYYKSI